jgi:formylglycine-generating enzyme
MKKVFILSAFLAFSLCLKSQTPEMILIEGGSFIMGNEYADAIDERPEHKVELKDFYIAKYEVLYDDFKMFCDATGWPLPEGTFGRGKFAVGNISWQAAVNYCNWLSGKENLAKCYDINRDGKIVKLRPDADGYRIPTEAEWEYAAKGGKKSKGYSFSGSNNPDTVAWYKGNSGAKTHEIGTKKSNELGIYDMTGGVWEWCWDWYAMKFYANSPASNPLGPDGGGFRVYRGGCWNSPMEFIRLTRRFSLQPDKSQGLIGIRLARNKK